MERAKLNKGVREVLRAIRWYRKHPNASERDLIQTPADTAGFPVDSGYPGDSDTGVVG